MYQRTHPIAFLSLVGGKVLANELDFGVQRYTQMLASTREKQ